MDEPASGEKRNRSAHAGSETAVTGGSSSRPYLVDQRCVAVDVAYEIGQSQRGCWRAVAYGMPRDSLNT